MASNLARCGLLGRRTDTAFRRRRNSAYGPEPPREGRCNSRVGKTQGAGVSKRWRERLSYPLRAGSGPATPRTERRSSARGSIPHRVVDPCIKGEVILGNRIPGCRAAVALSDHSIEAARHTTKYQLIGRPLVGHLRKLISGPTAPNASARSIAPHDAPGLRFRHTAVDACLVAVRASCQTRRKAMSLPL